MQEKVITLTREELDALTEHDAKVRAEYTNAIFADVEELIRASVKIEGARLASADRFLTKHIHKYAKEMYETLLSDVEKLKGKYAK